MAKDRNIKYADYDYGQPESEKRGMRIRSRSGDKRVLYAGLAFFVVPLMLGAIFSIPAVDDFFEGRKSTAEIAFGQSHYDIDACLAGLRMRLADLHEAVDLSDATALEITIEKQTRSKGTVEIAEGTLSLSGIDFDNVPEYIQVPIERDGFTVVSQGRPSQCAYTVDVIR